MAEMSDPVLNNPNFVITSRFLWPYISSCTTILFINSFTSLKIIIFKVRYYTSLLFTYTSLICGTKKNNFGLIFRHRQRIICTFLVAPVLLITLHKWEMTVKKIIINYSANKKHKFTIILWQWYHVASVVKWYRESWRYYYNNMWKLY